MKPILLGLHIPKCAGTTLIDRALRALAPEEIYQSSDLMRNYSSGRPEFLQILRPDALRFIFGHVVHEQMLRVLKRPAILFTGMREPKSRLASDISYVNRINEERGRPPVDIERHQKLAKNIMCNYLIHRFPTLSRPGEGGSRVDKAMRVLEHFSWCYFIDNFEQTSQLIASYLGVSFPAVNSNVGDQGGLGIDLDETLMKCDLDLYERAREKFYSVDIESAFIAPKPSVLQFSSQPAELSDYQRLLYRTTYGTYEGAKILDRVVGQKMAVISETAVELRYFIDLRRDPNALVF